MKKFFYREFTLYNLEEYELAIVDYNKAIELKPNFVEAYKLRGACYHQLGETDKAQADFNRAAQLDLDS